MRELATSILFLLLSSICNGFPFNDQSLSWTKRVDDLVSRLTVEEITAQMANGGRLTYSPSIPRLGIPPYNWGAECLRGDVGAGPATSFPQALGLAAAFSRSLIFDISEATGIEVRAKFNNYSSHGYFGEHSSTSCWSPVINIMRDPRWGRNQETYGEDPWMSGELSVAYVHGLQGNHPRYVRANAGCKHFDAYGGPENIPISRHAFDAKVKEEDLRNSFFPSFKKCVQAGTLSIMCSYNSVNGIPACANKELLTDVLREEWGFSGYVISDETAIEDIVLNHNYTKSIEDAVAAAVNAGTNIEDGKTDPYYNVITKAVQHGKLSETTIRNAVKPLFYTRMRLGLFDSPKMNPYSSLNVSTDVQSVKHRELAIQSAMQTFVLLKNTKNILPMNSKGTPYRQIAFVGPFSDNKRDIFGGYAPEPDPKYIGTVYEGLKSLGKRSTLASGCANQDPRCKKYNTHDILQAVTGSDLVVVSLGTGDRIEKEERDRADLNLPGWQFQLLQDAVSFSSSSATVILLLFNAGPLDISWAIANPRINVIIECFFPAQGTGEALKRTFLQQGTYSNPAARLPATWPARLDQYPPMVDYTMVNRTYRYFQSEPMFPFGYGLSYTTFKYLSLSAKPNKLRFTDILLVDVYVANSGLYDGEEVTQLYVSWPDSHLPSTPRLQMVGFSRRFIPNGSGITFSFKINLDQLALWNPVQHKYEIVPGEYKLYAGGQQPNQSVAVPSNVLSTSFQVVL